MADIEKVIEEVMSKKKGSKKWAKPLTKLKMTFDSQQAQLEPIYYWILDFINSTGWKTQKITDNFTSSPGSGHFAEMGQRATKMQEEGMKILGSVNQVIKASLNLIYDLKEFEMRLAHYDDADSDDKLKKEAGMLALKQVWLDSVDLKRGRGSIHQMAAELGFSTLREVFMIANSLEDVKKMNKDEEGGLINDSVMRVVIPRISDFLKWKEYSEKELRKRMSIEKNYLRSQIETIKLYSSWMKPYLKAAEDLKQQGFDGDAALVNAFSTSMFELTVLGKKSQDAPDQFENYKLKRKYHPILLITFKYRGHVSQRATQQGDYAYAMGGKVDMIFESYVLNEEELTLVEKELGKSDVADSIAYSEGTAEQALEELKEDLDHFLNDDEDKKKKAEKKSADNINPFSALFGIFKKSETAKKKGKEIENIKDIKPDNFVEKETREEAEKSANAGLYLVYDIYKKAHGMASAPGEGFDTGE